MKVVAEMIDRVLSAPADEAVRAAVRRQAEDLCAGFPVYGAPVRKLVQSSESGVRNNRRRLRTGPRAISPVHVPISNHNWPAVREKT